MAIDIETETKNLNYKSQNQEQRIPDIKPDDPDITKTRPLFGLKFFKELLKNDYVNITSNIRFNLRLDQFSQNKSEVSVGTRIISFYKYHPWMECTD